MIEINQEFTHKDFAAENSEKILITICSADQEYLDSFEQLLKIAKIDVELFKFAYCRNIDILKNMNIKILPSIHIVSNPEFLQTKIYQLHPTELYAKLNSFQTEYHRNRESHKQEYFKKIQKMISDNPIMMFIVGTPEKPMCRFTSKLIQKLQPYKIKFGFYDIEQDKPMVAFLKEYSKWSTFPQIFFDGQLMGGADSVCSLIDLKTIEEKIPQQAYMSGVSKLEQIQLLSRYLVLIDGPPDNQCELAVFLLEHKIGFQFYNLQLDQQIRSEVFNFISDHVDSSLNLEPYLLYKNTIYNITSLIKILDENKQFLEQV